jgi:predicted TIM-barrel fold metal-dependent hydrolase
MATLHLQKLATQRVWTVSGVIVDAHTHMFTRFYGATGNGPTAAVPRGRIRVATGEVLQLTPPLAAETAFPPEALLGYMDAAGVDRAVILQAPFFGERNDEVAKAVRRWPDRFTGAALLDPRSSNARESFKRLTAEDGFRIFKFEMSAANGLLGFYPDLRLDEPALDWLWAELEAMRGVVTVDLGPPGGSAYQTTAVRALASRHPLLTWVIAHMGKPTQACVHDTPQRRAWEEQVRLATLANVWLDLTGVHIWARASDERYPYPSGRQFIRDVVAWVGAEKLMWGTDIPGMFRFMTYEQMIELVTLGLGWLTDEALAAIMGTTAAHVYPWRGSR